ncbi:endo-1,3(4)-beta-glucanase [Colletotrichum tofieldiae]|uniref:Endo-1,3(4)-beta-glucanase n=1 Tax=Colletotrichum tofieldiae TaxID=708197 RepID=A0A161VGP0_9PEZI|nr:endo-1,3(4)-beta-glucanase [Colletotrichum tofieldiae]
MAYGLSHSYFGANFISDFNFINYVDPSNGFVRYQSQPDALAKGLYSINPATQAVTLGVDNTNVYGLNEGRPSLRLESKRQYNHGLFIGDFAHMPPSVCGLWPAFWMYGPDWPRNGEVDIIEGANQVTKNIISGHTTPGCRIPDAPQAAGQPLLRDCESPGTNNNAGCNYLPPASHPHTYGDSFNAVGGGVYALEWTSEAIRIWHWPRQSIPRDIIAKRPDPATWGLPSALFGTSTCEVDRYFKDMSIVIQTNFCGDYAANIWGKEGDTCNQRAPTCVEYVANNPGAFRNAYWEVNYIDVYQLGAINNTGPAEPTTTTTIKITSTIFTTVPNPATLVTTITQNGTVLVSTTTINPAGPTATAPPSPSTDPIVPDRDPATIGEYTYLGCYGSATGFQTFLLRASVADLTPQKCVDLCRPGKYAAVRDNQCFCAEVLDPDTRAEADRGRCSIPCPGNNTQLCGGTTNVSPAPSRLMQLHRRAAPANYLLTVYGRISDEVPPPAPPLGDPEPHAPSTSTLVTTITYTTVYATDAASLVPAEHRTTILVPGCNKYCGDGGPAAISVPLVTTVASCGGCGEDGANEVTLTVPLQVAAVPLTASATGYWPAGGQTTPAPPGAPTPSLVTVSAAADVNLAWAVGLGVAIAVVRSALMFF